MLISSFTSMAHSPLDPSRHFAAVSRVVRTGFTSTRPKQPHLGYFHKSHDISSTASVFCGRDARRATLAPYARERERPNEVVADKASGSLPSLQ
jgi:hypothetical protein